MLLNGANPDLRDSTGNTPLHKAARNGILNVVQVLLKYHADFSAQNDDGNTPLHLVAENLDLSFHPFTRDHKGVVKALVLVGADANQENYSHQTATNIAADASRKGIRSEQWEPTFVKACAKASTNRQLLLNYEMYNHRNKVDESCMK
ncbi:MAG: ankyrin repeat domain-containing protein [Gammaproteobacteria bacterium]